MSVPTLIALLVAGVAAPLNWFVTVRLWRLSLQNPRIRVLRERAVISVALAVIVTIFAVVFLNNDFGMPLFTGDTTRLITRMTVLVWSVLPASYFLWFYRRS